MHLELRKQRLALYNLALLLLGVGLLGVSPTASQAQREAAIPDLLSSLEPLIKAPLWVSEDKAFDAAGALRTEFFEEHVQSYDYLQNLQRIPAGSCYEVGPTYVNYIDALPFETLMQIGRYAPRVLHGTVIARKGGFFANSPGTMLLVRRSQELRVAEYGADFLFFLPLGEVRAGSRRICREDPTLAPLPDIGDELVVFARPSSSDLHGVVVATVMEAYLTIKSGEVYLPRRLKAEPGPLVRPKAEVFEAVERGRP